MHPSMNTTATVLQALQICADADAAIVALLRSRLPATPIVAVSGASPEVLARARAAGAAASARVARSINPQATTATDRHRVLMGNMGAIMNAGVPKLPYFALRNTALTA